MHTDPPPAAESTTHPNDGPHHPPRAPVLLRTPDGTTYAGGRDALDVTPAAGRRRRWPLPPQAVGTAETAPVLMRTDDGLLFLYNAPGRLLRLRPTPAAADPLALEATFTQDLPDDVPTRVWLDPAGRIDFAVAGHQLTVTFPAGRIPKPIAEMIPAAAAN